VDGAHEQGTQQTESEVEMSKEIIEAGWALVLGFILSNPLWWFYYWTNQKMRIAKWERDKTVRAIRLEMMRSKR
jgi:hypothetical protein